MDTKLPALERTHTHSSSSATRITVTPGNGIGPEITAAVLVILAAAGANLEAEFMEVGETVYLAGNTSGIPEETWESIRRTRVLLKGPITTPQGGGYKSLNVTLRKTLGLFANVRPCRAYAPYIPSRHPAMNVVIMRENEEDLYAGIEHRQTADVTQCLKLITRNGSERIVRYAFEYARRHGRKRVTCFTKDNIMKITDGLFHRMFDEIAQQYSDIETCHQIVDIGMANFVHRPEAYDVVVLPNLYGDILSDIAAQMTGSVGIGGSVNIGPGGALFEAIHGSAPDLPPNVANPSGLLLAAVEMLHHIGRNDVGATVHNAWLTTIEDGIHTADIANEATVERATTKQFTQAVIERLGRKPKHLPVAESMPQVVTSMDAAEVARASEATPLWPVEVKTLVGVDVFLDWNSGLPENLATLLKAATAAELALKMITNRGVKVWPNGHPETICTDHWRCRFQVKETDAEIAHSQIVSLLRALDAAGFDFIKMENLYNFDGKPGYALGQGQ
uniref:Isocitrate dehydrogenase [NADP] n=1 Tax=mine drainage metagenome TaxID=410659 RepID=E6QIQ8_9ZZZZ